jgi:aspartokinase
MKFEVIKLGGSILRDSDAFNRAAEIVECKLKKDILPVCVVSAMRARSVVGSEMRGMKGFFSRLSGVLARHGFNIEQATQPNSENIIRFSIDNDDLYMAVAAVYNEFFKRGKVG